MLNSPAGKALVLFEFQGVFESVHLFDGVFDSTTLQMKFKGYYLQGKRIKKEYTAIRRTEEGELENIGLISEVILFDQYPRYTFD